MIILPAIDIQGGECVRLLRGDYATAHKVAESAEDTAKKFKEAGAEWLHIVDLDGAKEGEPVNHELIFRIAETSGLKLEAGGGIRDMKTITSFIDHGISRVILGSAAIHDQALVKQAVKEYGDRIAVGIDARNGMVAGQGWTETSEVYYIDMAKQMESIGVKNIIFTDISKDGTLGGPNFVMLDKMNHAVDCNIIASGGVASIMDIATLLDLNIYGAICGKALYSGTLDLAQAICICKHSARKEQL